MKTSLLKFLLAWKNYAFNNFPFIKYFIAENKIFKILIIICWLVWVVLYSRTASINIPTTHIDGAFQTASGLHRLSAGQFPGKDFYPYLGIGPLFALYPFFNIMGANMSASVFSSQLMVLFIGVLSVTLIWHLIFQPRSFLTSLSAGSLLFLVPIGVANHFSISLPDWLIFSTSPGVSLRPLRAIAPYLVAILYYFFIFHNSIIWKKYALSGLLTGLILLWSNDFAIPSAGLLVILIYINAFYKKELRIKNVLIYTVSTILSWIILLSLTTHGHPIELLKYNFLDVANDQWWYFGSYDESTRILNLKQLTKLFSHENYFPLIVLALTTIATLKTKLFEHILLLWIGFILFFGGVIASVGGHLGGYFGSFYFWGMMVTIIYFLYLIRTLFIDKILDHKSKIIMFSTLAVLIVSIFLVITSANKLHSELFNAKNDPNKFFIPELGGYLSNEWKDYIYLAKNSKSTNVFEEYWGLWSATRKTFSNWPVDSVIHALGDTRELSINKLQNADTIISTRYLSSPTWQPWNLSQNYWFYEYLLKDWTPYFLSPNTIVWHKNEKQRQLKNIGCSFSNNESHKLILQAHNSGFYEINMQYKFTGNGRFLIMMQNNVSFGADIGGYVSINPNAIEVKFPAYIEKDDPANILNVKVIGNTNYNFNIKSCTAAYIPSFSEDNEVLAKPWWASIDNDFFVTDNNWIHGISRNWAGFFIPNVEKYSDKYIVGRFVKFIDGNNRLITRVTSNGLYLRVYLAGEPLNPENVGWPSDFIVTDN